MEVLVLTDLHEDNRQTLNKSLPNITFKYPNKEKLTQTDIDACDVIVGIPDKKFTVNRPDLQAILLSSAGSERFVKKDVLHKDTKLANASGVHSTAMAEHTIGMILTMNKQFRNYFTNMENHVWEEVVTEGKEIVGSTVVIVGLGDIGFEMAKRLKPFGCHIIGVKRTISAVPDCIDELYTVENLDEVLPKADYIISCLPETPETIHIFNQNRFSLMKDDAFLINVGRGSAIDLVALKETLNQDKFYAVALDVVEVEPLATTDSLWDNEKVFITPHISGGYKWDSARKNFTDLVIRNLQNLLDGKILENEVNFQTGYRKEVTYKTKM